MSDVAVLRVLANGNTPHPAGMRAGLACGALGNTLVEHSNHQGHGGTYE